MTRTTALTGIALLILGLATYIGLAGRAPTALIPAAFGILYLVLALIARRPAARKHAMHFAALLSLIGFAATVSAIVPMSRLLAGEAVPRPAAAWEKTGMALLCFFHLALSVRSFVQVRLLRRDQ